MRHSNRFTYEQAELKALVDEKFQIKLNSGSLPQAQLNMNTVGTWVYPADKVFRTY